MQYYRGSDSSPVPNFDFKRSSWESTSETPRPVLGLFHFCFTGQNMMTHLLFFPQKSSCYKYKHTYLYHNINLLQYKVFSQWTVIEASNRLLALQAHKYFQTFISFTLFVFLFHFHSPPCTKPKQTKRIFKKDIDKRYSWRVLTSCSRGTDPIPINVNMNLPLLLKTDQLHNHFWGRKTPDTMCF